MESYADLSCALRVNANCEACKTKVMEVLSSICGVYSVTIDANEGTARVSGEVDPNVLLRALSRSGKHAEVLWVKLKSPAPSRPNYDHRYASYPYHYRSTEQPYHYQYQYPYRRSLPLSEHEWYNPYPRYPSPRLSMMEHPWHASY